MPNNARVKLSSGAIASTVGVLDTGATTGWFEYEADSNQQFFMFGQNDDASGSGTVALATDRIYFIPVYLPGTGTIDTIGIEEITTNEGGKHAILGLYSLGSDGKPSTLLGSTGNVDLTPTGTAGGSCSIQISNPGVYAIALISNATTAEVRKATVDFSLPNIFGGTTSTGAATVSMYNTGGSFASGLPPIVNSSLTIRELTSSHNALNLYVQFT